MFIPNQNRRPDSPLYSSYHNRVKRQVPGSGPSPAILSSGLKIPFYKIPVFHYSWLMIREYAPGLLIVSLIAAASVFLAGNIPMLGSVTAAIIIGFMAGNTLPRLTDRGKSGIRFAEKRLLNAAIILMGFDLELSAAAGLGFRTLPLIVGIVALSITLGLLAGKLLPLPAKLALLLGIGNGVCGSAAIAASAPLLGANREDVGISIAVINLLGALGIFLVPSIALLLNLGIPQSGILIGGTLQAVGQTVAAGLRMGEEVAGLSTLVKMGRVLMLGLVLIGIPFFIKSETKGRFPFPPFIAGFFLCALLMNLVPVPPSLLMVINEVKKALLLCAMVAIGMGIKIKSLAGFGPLALAAGAGMFMLNILFVLTFL
jgi:uncharacterized integral membrane protein (TIGR00698 family)